jgi:hypothetical protein
MEVESCMEVFDFDTTRSQKLEVTMENVGEEDLDILWTGYLAKEKTGTGYRYRILGSKYRFPRRIRIKEGISVTVCGISGYQVHFSMS